MKARSNVAPIGCYTKGWRRSVVVTRDVRAEMDADRSLAPLFRLKMREHDSKLRRLIARRDLVQTVCWRERTHGERVVISTGCTRDARLHTRVHHWRGPLT